MPKFRLGDFEQCQLVISCTIICETKELDSYWENIAGGNSKKILRE
jgi:hypothetical protein